MPCSPEQLEDHKERKTLAANLKHAGFSYKEIGQLVNRNQASVWAWFSGDERKAFRKERDKVNHWTNRDHRLKTNRAWYKKNAATERIGSRNRIAALQGYKPADITPEQETRLREQQKECQLCGTHESEFKKGLATDHNHKTGEVRGRLCHGCNAKIAALDFYDENPELRAAANVYRTNAVRF